MSAYFTEIVATQFGEGRMIGVKVDSAFPASLVEKCDLLQDEDYRMAFGIANRYVVWVCSGTMQVLQIDTLDVETYLSRYQHRISDRQRYLIETGLAYGAGEVTDLSVEYTYGWRGTLESALFDTATKYGSGELI